MELVDDCVSGEIGTPQAGSHHSYAEWEDVFMLHNLTIVGSHILLTRWLGFGVEKAFFVLGKPT